jgi:nanoRNase/pAp phosphatase (c-di-AMP/oligoRNAs hydrolase)
MNKPYPFKEIGAAVNASQNVAILLPKEVNFDQVAASLALFLSLEKAGKSVAIASLAPMTVEFSHLVGLDKIASQIGQGQDLIITLDYPLEKIEKVSYNDEGGKLNLVIQPKSGVPAITQDRLSFKNAGGKADLVFLIGGQDKESFGSLIKEEDWLSQNTISITRDSALPLGKVHLFDAGAAAYAEIITALLVSLAFPPDQDIAQNLYLGLVEATANFSSPAVSADAFEAAAILLRAGAKKEKERLAEAPIQAAAPPSSDWLGPKIYRGATLV